MKKYKEILTMSDTFNHERELYILAQDESIDSLTFALLVCKVLVFILSIVSTTILGFIAVYITWA